MSRVALFDAWDAACKAQTQLIYGDYESLNAQEVNAARKATDDALEALVASWATATRPGNCVLLVR